VDERISHLRPAAKSGAYYQLLFSKHILEGERKKRKEEKKRKRAVRPAQDGEGFYITARPWITTTGEKDKKEQKKEKSLAGRSYFPRLSDGFVVQGEQGGKVKRRGGSCIFLQNQDRWEREEKRKKKGGGKALLLLALKPRRFHFP